MIRHHPTVISLARRLRPAPADLAAAAAPHDPSWLLHLQAAQPRGEEAAKVRE